MNAHRQQPVPTLEQRRALAAYLAAQREAIHAAERARILQCVAMGESLQRRSTDAEAAADLPVWQQIKVEYRAAPLHQQIGIVLFFAFGVGVAVAIAAGWLS